MGDRTGGQVQGPGQRALLISPRRHHFDLFPLGHPLIADLGQQINVQLVSKEQRGARAQLFKRQANPR